MVPLRFERLQLIFSPDLVNWASTSAFSNISDNLSPVLWGRRNCISNIKAEFILIAILLYSSWRCSVIWSFFIFAWLIWQIWEDVWNEAKILAEKILFVMPSMLGEFWSVALIKQLILANNFPHINANSIEVSKTKLSIQL